VVELRAIAYPRVGVARVLQDADGDDPGERSLRLLANAHGTVAARVAYVSPGGNDDSGNGTLAAPYRTIFRAAVALDQAGGTAHHADGGVISCLPGQYEWGISSNAPVPITTDAWLTITTAPGVTRDQVEIVEPSTITGGVGIKTHLVRLNNVTVRANLYAGNDGPQLWLDHSIMPGTGPLDPLIYVSQGWYYGFYATDSTSTNVVNGFPGATLARSCLINLFYNDGFPGAQMVINSEAKYQTYGLDPLGNDYHSDVWQERSPWTDDNVILYGVVGTDHCTEQGVFSRNSGQSNMAIVNCAFDLSGYPDQSQWRSRTQHMLVRHNTFLGAAFLIGLSDQNSTVVPFLGSKDVLFKRNLFQWVNLDDPMHVTGPNYPTPSVLDGSATFDTNHFIDLWPANDPNANQPIWCAQPIGTNATTGPTIPAGVGAYGSNPPPND
jgi:hypothetical protein